GSKEKRHKRRHLDELLDEGLKQTFPASDPVSVGHFTSTEAPSHPVDRGGADSTTKTKGPRKPARARRGAGAREGAMLRKEGVKIAITVKEPSLLLPVHRGKCSGDLGLTTGFEGTRTRSDTGDCVVAQRHRPHHKIHVATPVGYRGPMRAAAKS